MKKKKITFVDGDDWQGLYVNDELVYENHRAEIRDLAKIIDIQVINADLDWLADRGHLPQKLSEVVQEP